MTPVSVGVRPVWKLRCDEAQLSLKFLCCNNSITLFLSVSRHKCHVQSLFLPMRVVEHLPFVSVVTGSLIHQHINPSNCRKHPREPHIWLPGTVPFYPRLFFYFTYCAYCKPRSASLILHRNLINSQDRPTRSITFPYAVMARSRESNSESSPSETPPSKKSGWNA